MTHSDNLSLSHINLLSQPAFSTSSFFRKENSVMEPLRLSLEGCRCDVESQVDMGLSWFLFLWNRAFEILFFRNIIQPTVQWELRFTWSTDFTCAHAHMHCYHFFKNYSSVIIASFCNQSLISKTSMKGKELIKNHYLLFICSSSLWSFECDWTWQTRYPVGVWPPQSEF